MTFSSNKNGVNAPVSADTSHKSHLHIINYLSPEQRIPRDHPLRPLCVMADGALRELQPRFRRSYASTGRPSIAPERLLRALLLQALYSVRSERMLMEQLDYSLLFRWSLGLSMDDGIWDATVFTKNRQRLLDGDIADAFFAAVLKQARQRNLLSDEHFTVDGTLWKHGQDRRVFAEPMTTTSLPLLERGQLVIPIDTLQRPLVDLSPGVGAIGEGGQVSECAFAQLRELLFAGNRNRSTMPVEMRGRLWFNLGCS